MSKTKTPTKKLTLSDMQPKPLTITVTHPVLKVGGEVTLCSPFDDHYQEELQAQLMDQNTDEMKPRELLKFLSHMAATAIIDWDAEYFEQPYSPEAAQAVLSKPSNGWIRDQISTALQETERFFQMP